LFPLFINDDILIALWDSSKNSLKRNIINRYQLNDILEKAKEMSGDIDRVLEFYKIPDTETRSCKGCVVFLVFLKLLRQMLLTKQSPWYYTSRRCTQLSICSCQSGKRSFKNWNA
jgi:hypothetical protein